MELYGTDGINLLKPKETGNKVAFQADPVGSIIREATQTVEDELSLEDSGWIKLGTTANDIIQEATRAICVKESRLYWAKDPLAKQAIRLWTDYTFGTGMEWSCEDEGADKVLRDYWYSKDNQPVLSTRGQRKASSRLLVDGELFFAIFLGKTCRVRLIDTLEMTEIITDPDDRDDEKVYRREWADAQGGQHTSFYASHRNMKYQGYPDSAGQQQTPDQDGVVVYHLTENTLGNRGYPLLVPALDWMKQYRRFLASRVAIMLALARFAWKVKVKGGESAVTAAKAHYTDQEIPAGSVGVENQAYSMDPIKTDSGAKNAYDDGRQLKLQVAAATGIPEQYFGDISIGNLATAKTVELPMMKMFQAYQAIWNDAFQDMDEIVLENAGFKPTKLADITIDRDFPPIAPADAAAAAGALSKVITSIPDLAKSRDVIQSALINLGINNTGDVLDELEKLTKEKQDNPAPPAVQPGAADQAPDQAPPEEPAQEQRQFEATLAVADAMRELRTVLAGSNNGHKEEDHDDIYGDY